MPSPARAAVAAIDYEALCSPFWTHALQLYLMALLPEALMACCAIVATKLAKIKHTSLFVPSPASYARAAVAAIDYEALCSPFWTHALSTALSISWRYCPRLS
jgi:hypothetical protein